mmetsp:Transcript_1923/g.3099  ORF Transcript_1923/g.3099 Transcript_1923/m.3099 type:complete len:84 (-) Transcript_1923:1269-1520(-)
MSVQVCQTSGRHRERHLKGRANQSAFDTFREIKPFAMICATLSVDGRETWKHTTNAFKKRQANVLKKGVLVSHRIYGFSVHEL